MTRSPAISTLFLFSLAIAGAAPVSGQARAAGAIADGHKTLEGVVASVDGATLKLADGGEVKTDGKTKVTRAGKTARLADLQAGDRVKYALDDAGVAVYVHAEPKR